MKIANFIHPEAPKKREVSPGENLENKFDNASQGKRERMLEDVIEIRKHGNWLQQFIFTHQDSLNLSESTLSDLLYVAKNRLKEFENEGTDDAIVSARVLNEEIEWFDRNKDVAKLDFLTDVMQKLGKKERDLIFKIESGE